MDIIGKEVRRMLPHIVQIRCYLHQHPEIAGEEVGTAALVERELHSLGIETRRIGRTGVLGTIVGGRGKGKIVALRADMDALPMQEQTGLPYASQNDNMHSCGHDGHTAVLLGASRVLAGMRQDVRGTIKLFFQPAEEGYGGGREMCQAGVMENPKVDAVFALHGFGESNVGHIATSPGIVMANVDSMYLDVLGRGGHGARPNLAVDPIVIAARIVDALQTIVSREIAPDVPAVVTIGSIHGGTETNIIPDTVQMSGTIRSLEEATRRRLFASIRRIAVKTAAALGGRCKVRIEPGYPATVNDPAMTDLVKRVGARILGAGKVHGLPNISMGGEDFSYYLQKAPGCFFRLGLNEKRRPGKPLHNSQFDFNDNAIPYGIRMMVGVALEFLAGR